MAEYIPEFARHGKEHTTIRHVLTHRAGIPSLAGHADQPQVAEPGRHRAYLDRTLARDDVLAIAFGEHQPVIRFSYRAMP